MPLKLVPPRKGKSPNWTIRGAYLGIGVDKSSGTHKRSVARSVLRGLERAIERGEYPAKPKTDDGGPTFLSAAVGYMEAGRRPRYVAKLIKHFGTTPLSEIGQAAIDEAAIELYPNVTACTRNTCVYSNCWTDADCRAGFFCSPTVALGCGSSGVQGFYCHTGQDTCVDDSDCVGPAGSPGGYCAFDGSVGHWTCTYGACAG